MWDGYRARRWGDCEVAWGHTESLLVTRRSAIGTRGARACQIAKTTRSARVTCGTMSSASIQTHLIPP